jgi:8-hydroxy-5-deazaflavin:NADPH oxidoreductase
MPSYRPIIAILGGTGKEGSALALRWASAGYKILVGSRQVEKALVTADRINNQVAKNMVSGLENRDAASQSEICVLTIVYTAHRQVLESVKVDLSGKILVDTTTRVDFRDPRPPEPPCAAQEAQNLLGPSVRVVAAFQSVPAKSLIKNIQQPMDADVLVCSDNIPAADEVIQLAQAAGMRGYYAGGLANAIVVEGLTSILISMNKHYGVKNSSVRITGITVDR